MKRIPEIASHAADSDSRAEARAWSAAAAKIITETTNPCMLSVIVLLAVGFSHSADLRLLLGEVLALLVFLVALPAAYVSVRMSADGSYKRRPKGLMAFLREHPRDILALGMMSAVPYVVVLAWLGAPAVLVATLTALLMTSLTVALVNFLHRVSYHLAAITSLAFMVGLIWQPVFPAALALIPLIGWARYRLGEHSLLQLVAGAALGAIVSLATSYFVLISEMSL